MPRTARGDKDATRRSHASARAQTCGFSQCTVPRSTVPFPMTPPYVGGASSSFCLSSFSLTTVAALPGFAPPGVSTTLLFGDQPAVCDVRLRTRVHVRPPRPSGLLRPHARDWSGHEARLGSRVGRVGRYDRAAAPHMRVGPRGRALSRVQRPPQWRAARVGGADATPT